MGLFTWTAESDPSVGCYDVTWSPSLSLFVAVGGHGPGQIITSSNGTSWTLVAEPTTNLLTSVCWCDALSLFVAVGGDTGTDLVKIVTSSDGVTWSVYNTGFQGFGSFARWSHVLGQILVGVSGFTGPPTSTTSYVLSSTDGVSWAATVSPFSGPAAPSPAVNFSTLAAAWSPTLGLWALAGHDNATGACIATSPDGSRGRSSRVRSTGSTPAWKPTATATR